MPARLALVFSLLVVLIAPDGAGAADKVTVALDFTLSGYHAPWFVAQDKGYFAEQGLFSLRAAQLRFVQSCSGND